ncbi:MAG: GGDEF domain-containing protein [Candidatus Limivivens sp.]|nr:GGDEF domain-containing protein [Candidatus Limivivens sp.]
MFDLYTAIILITILFLMITIADARINPLITKDAKKKTVITCLLIGVSALGECIGVLTDGAPPSFLLLHKAAKLVEICMAPAIGVAAAIAYGGVKKPKTAIAFISAHALFECIALHFGWVFRVDAQNVYHREFLFPIYVAVFTVALGYGFLAIIRSGKVNQVGMDSVLVCTLFMLMAGIGSLFLFHGVRIAYLCIAVGNALFYSRYCKIMLQVDAVTRLLNRRCYDVNITDLGSRALILFFDVDKFKQVNDTYGHSVGDICLKNVAQQLRNVYGRYGFCYRVGGDEFCVILHDHLENIEELNSRFVSAIRELQKEDGRMPNVSLGYAYYDAAASYIQDVIKEADAMLYRNKSM